MPSKETGWRPQAWRLLALWTLTLLAYANSFQGGFVFDNGTAILKDPRVHALTQENIRLILHEEYWYNSTTTGLYRPLTTFSYLVNFALFGNGPHPAGYHWLNFLLHGANIWLVYLLGLRLLEDCTAATALAALWGMHPLLTESVSNMVGRADLLAAFGVLAGLLCHLAARQTAKSDRVSHFAWLGALAVAAAIAIFSKEAGAVLPAVMLLYDVTWAKRAEWRRLAPGYLAMALPFAVFFSLRADLHARLPMGMVPYADNPLLGADFWTARFTAIRITGKYLGLFLWPVNQSADYSYNAVPLAGWQDAGAWIALAVCLLAALVAFRSWLAAKPLFFFVTFFFLTLAPTANVLMPIGSIMAERFVYLPCVGLAGCAAWAAKVLSRRAPRAVWAGVSLLCLALAARTFARNPVWRDDVSLWTSVASVYPTDFKAHTTLAETFANSGPRQLDRAIGEADRSLEILATLPDRRSTSRPYATAGMCYRLKGDSLSSPAAAVWYEKALATLLHGEQVDVGERQEIVRMNLEHGKRVSAAGWMPLYLELGRACLRLNRPREAMAPLAYGSSHSADPEFSVELSHAWQAAGDWQRAAIVLIERIESGATSQRLAAELVSLYKHEAPTSCALREAGGTTSVNLECPLVHNHLCAAAQELTNTDRQAGQIAARSFGCR